ncbi:7995_t:CDS:2 [Ambispora leptoticha]|uniref:Methylated-DNA--protein-cysteine methyltransferase n=1 Tax=Ambispora leptoticha TaxID=144679 RepID=A0A9N9G500_9GLOM|nr:7995_t:CDS:2 [Ambispora leptoticha]
MKGISGQKLHEIYFAAWEKGLKTTYYLRTLGASRIESSTLDAAKFGFTQKRNNQECLLNKAADQTIISFLKRRFKTTPLSLIYKLFRTKKVKVDGENIRYYHHRLKVGEKIEVNDKYLQLSNQIIYPLSQNKMYFKIIYEDKNILLALKEHGITMPSLDNAVRHYLSEKNPTEYQRQIENYFVLIAAHRLDKLTKGLVIYPKNPVAKKVLYQAIGDKSKITKKYLAICEKSPKKALPNYISGYLWKNNQAQKMEFAPKSTNPQAKFCALEIKKVGGENIYQTLEITLHTGRKHQIRSILSYLGYPVIGDEKYGSKIKIENKIHLLAYKIEFNNLPSPLAYLNGKSLSSNFSHPVYNCCSQIPKGKVSTYKYIAEFLHISPREVGQILKNNPFLSSEVPCHRVIATNFFIGGYYGE